MMKVLIVENEALERVHLKTIIDWRANDYELVGEAENGGEALSLIDKLSPDIVITDIRMPVLNGLELIAARRVDQHGPEFLIMSGYDDYQLVRRGLTLGAYDYLRKLDLNPASLLEALQGMRAKISRQATRDTAPADGNPESGKTGHYTDSESGKSKNAARSWFVAELLKGYPRGKESYAQDLEKLDIRLDPDRICCAYICVEEKDKFEEDLLNDTGKLSRSILSISEEICRDSFYVNCFEGQLGEFFVFASPRGPKSSFVPTIERLIEMLSIYLNLHAKAGLCNYDEDRSRENPGSGTDEDSLPMVLAVRRAQAALRNVQTVGVKNLLSWSEFHGQDSRAVRDVEAYIAAHYAEDISLIQAAAHACLSANYFSSLFKRHTGSSFTDYLNKVRIEAAKQMLAGTDLLVYEIAERCGYRDTYYFNRVFKKLAGVSPGAYKRGT